MSENFPALTELSVKDFNVLAAIKSPTDIKKMRLVNEFEDDHIPSADAIINNVKISLWCCGSKVVGALEFNDSAKAKKTVYDALRTEFYVNLAAMFDETDEAMKQTIEENREFFETVLSYLRSLRKNNPLRKEMSEYLADSKVVSKDFELLV